LFMYIRASKNTTGISEEKKQTNCEASVF
jgi:hypothetical protein